jgi:hypothetical protein
VGGVQAVAAAVVGLVGMIVCRLHRYRTHSKKWTWKKKGNEKRRKTEEW